MFTVALAEANMGVAINGSETVYSVLGNVWIFLFHFLLANLLIVISHTISATGSGSPCEGY